MTITIGSLFSGIGGLEFGLERAGLGPVIWQAEIDPYCRAVLARHWPNARRFADVREVRSGVADRVDVVCGGFPCQPVSVAGKRRAQADARWLWPEYARIVRELRPACVVAENVPGLRSSGLRDVLADLAGLGFDVEWSHLSAAEVGAPHKRERVWIVATHPDRVAVREQPGWLSRACGARASDGEAGFAADADSRGLQAGGPEGDGRDAPLLRGRAGSRHVQAAPEHGRGAAPDADAEGQSQPPWTLAAERGWARNSGWWDAPPAVRRMDDGLSERLDASPDDARGRAREAGNGVEAPDDWRIGALGNAVVAQVAEVIGRALVESAAGSWSLSSGGAVWVERGTEARLDG